MANVYVVGGSGFIGSELLKELVVGPWKLNNIDKRKSYLFDTSIADVRNSRQLDDIPVIEDNPDKDWVVLLAAEHRDDVRPNSLYYDVNVGGAQNIVDWMDKRRISKIIFTSSVAVYGLNKQNPDETFDVDPFNDYGKSKWEAEEVLRNWFKKDPMNRTIIIVRPTVVFGPGNRGNVYNLLQNIASGRFLMIGKGQNKKSMAYVNNIVGFIRYSIEKDFKGYHLYNYADKPDLSTNELILETEKSLDRKISKLRVPYVVGYMGGLAFDIVAKVLNRKFVISAVRVKKFCATTQFEAGKMKNTGFQAKFSLKEGLNVTIKSILEAAPSVSDALSANGDRGGE